MEMRGRVPAYQGDVLHFGALNLATLCEGEGNPRSRELERNAYTRTCARALSPLSPRIYFLLLERSLQPTPSPLCELA